MNRTLLLVFLMTGALTLFAIDTQTPGAGPGPGVKYATDAYPGFDREEEIVAPSRKEPRWFSWINGPNAASAAEQMAYCRQLLEDGNASKAAKQLDALVREWPTSEEAPRAQELLAEVEFDQLNDWDEAFRAYMYLADFYSLQCDYVKVTDKMHDIARRMREDGKTILFFRFANTVDVRRAFEACVLRAPGAVWVPSAMLEIGDLREEEGKYEAAVKVYENLINIHGGTPEAKVAILREANARMVLLREHAYNRDRCQDTIDYLKLSLTTCDVADLDQIKDFLAEARAMNEAEAYRAAMFYDSETRTVRSAINAYERFLADYPDSQCAEEVKERLAVLKETEK